MGGSVTVVPPVLQSVDVVNQSGLYAFTHEVTGDTTYHSFNHRSNKLHFFSPTFLYFFIAGYLTALKHTTALSSGKLNGRRNGLFIIELFSALGDRIRCESNLTPLLVK